MAFSGDVATLLGDKATFGDLAVFGDAATLVGGSIFEDRTTAGVRVTYRIESHQGRAAHGDTDSSNPFEDSFLPL